ncbi:hypothetical protein IJ579_06070 [bacterium]|nr:hypothetical protein [bacterium]
MPVKIPQAKIYKTFSAENLKNTFTPRNFVKQMASDGFLPVIALEAFVESGRTYQAYQRGGFDEARERITEEFSGAVFWLGGVTGLNWLFEKAGKKLLKLPKHTVDIASDTTRRPLDNYLAGEVKKDGTKITRDLMAKFKFTKVIASVLIANGFIGFVLPKINQAITRSYHKNDKKQKQLQPQINSEFFKQPTMLEFTGRNNKKDISFGGAWDLLAIANNFENKRNWKLLSVDAGTATGRAYSARNNDERIEILFRDLSSIFFYMFNMNLMNKWLNKIEQGRNSRLDPVSAEFTTEYMQNYLNEKATRTATIEEFAQEMLGNQNELPHTIKEMFKGGKTVTLADFNAELERIGRTDLKEIATKMSKLQPEIIGEAILTEGQVKDIFTGGHINNPEFLMEFYKNHFGTMFMSDKFKFLEKYKYVADGELDALKADLKAYVESIIKDAKSANIDEITSDLLKKASKKNFRLNALNWGTGFVISAAFLSTFIPKLQYLITKLRTGKDGFPGTEEYRNEKN